MPWRRPSTPRFKGRAGPLRAEVILALVLAGACEARPPAPSHESARAGDHVQSSAPERAGSAEPRSGGAARAAAVGGFERQLGRAPQLRMAPVPVEQLLANPEPHLGKAVKCSGRVARVCQNAGCWLELQAAAGEGDGLRVPMAGHSFFVPQDAVGQLAVIEGELRRQPLPDRQREHYASEGMKAVGPLSLEATSVVLR